MDNSKECATILDMNHEKLSVEHPRPKDFNLKWKLPEDKPGHLEYEYGGRKFDWFIREETEHLILVNGNEKDFSDELIQAMKDQAYPILRKLLKQRRLQNLKNFSS